MAEESRPSPKTSKQDDQAPAAELQNKINEEAAVVAVAKAAKSAAEAAAEAAGTAATAAAKAADIAAKAAATATKNAADAAFKAANTAATAAAKAAKNKTHTPGADIGDDTVKAVQAATAAAAIAATAAATAAEAVKATAAVVSETADLIAVDTASKALAVAEDVALKAADVQEQYNRNLIEASIDPLFTISPDGIITDVNEAAEKALGVGRGRLIGTEFSDYFTEPGMAREAYQKTLKLGAVYDYSLTLEESFSKMIRLSCNFSIYPGRDGKPAGVFVAARDVTEYIESRETSSHIPSNSKTRSRAARITRITALISVAAGTMILFGWILGNDALKGAIWPGWLVVKANAGLCFVLAGASLFIGQTNGRESRTRVRKILSLMMAWFVIAIPVLTLAEYFFGWNLGIDTVLFREGATAGLFYPGRMALLVAVSFTMIGIALVVKKGRLAWLIVQALSLSVLWLSVVSLLSNLYQATGLFAFKISVPVSPMAAIVMVLLSFGLLFSRAEEGLALTMTSDLMGGRMARRLIPTFFSILIISGYAESYEWFAKLVSVQVGIAIAVVINITLFLLLVWLNARDLNRMDFSYRKSQDALRHNLARITETQDKLAASNESLEHQVIEVTALNAELEAFAFAVSHDLRSPLRSIDGFSQILVEDYADKMDAQELDYFGRIRAAAARMGQLIDDILKLSRVTRGELNYKKLDMTALATGVAEQKQQEYSDRSVKVTIMKGLMAVGDEGLVTAALENLFDNAWKYTGKTKRPAVEFGKRSVEGEDLFFVKDNGIGFDERYVDKLFKPFQRLHQEGDFPGTGIGLATVKRIVNRHGGRTMAESKNDSGATFYFSLAATKQKGEKHGRTAG